ncbi:hypothetical protein XENOCAPTIV_029743 [Xenoophorus captivus]|uniref:Uncharacterized protein n=1 Tax=Xenoophorus captivus TaxID=1517983 RepID=A0ABV0QDE7_9TELE
MDPRDTAPDSWEQEDDVEATVDGQLETAFTTLNVNAKPFVPNVNAAEFVPPFAMRSPSENVDAAVPVENGDTEMTAEEPWDQKDEEPTEEEPGGGDRGPGESATPEDTAPEMMEEEEEVLVPKVPPVQPDAPKKEHINVVFIGHVGQC